MSGACWCELKCAYVRLKYGADDLGEHLGTASGDGLRHAVHDERRLRHARIEAAHCAEVGRVTGGGRAHALDAGGEMDAAIGADGARPGEDDLAAATDVLGQPPLEVAVDGN